MGGGTSEIEDITDVITTIKKATNISIPTKRKAQAVWFKFYRNDAPATIYYCCAIQDMPVFLYYGGIGSATPTFTDNAVNFNTYFFSGYDATIIDGEIIYS